MHVFNISCLVVAFVKGLVGGPFVGPFVGLFDLTQRHLLQQDAVVCSSDLPQRQRQQKTAHIAAEFFESI